MLVPFLRTLILYIFIIIAIRLMGKRQVGEMQPSELVITILVSAVASVPMQDIDIPLAHGLVPILTLIGAEVIISSISLHNLSFRRLLCGKPVVVIENGRLNQRAMRSLRLSLDDLFEDLRLKDVFDIRDVHWAQVETNGQLSILLESRAQPVTAAVLSLSPRAQDPFHLLISDGEFLPENLTLIQKNRQWLERVMAACGAKEFSDVFFLCADKNGNTIYAKKER